MNVFSIVSICVSAGSFLIGGGLIFKLIEIGKQNGKMEQRVFTLEQRTAEDRQKDDGKFDRLYEGKNETHERVVRVEKDVERIAKSVEALTALVNKIDTKIDGLAQR